ncbi:MAG TPA: endonuclease/exonuclease/phosphatase family protein [Phycisphaerales bacterium]|nr:endonuclease/exonuclease/phosphatase family protein [Phycisphaerales bacterium]
MDPAASPAAPAPKSRSEAGGCRRRVRRTAGWLTAIMVLGACSAWAWAGHAWIADLGANLTAQWAGVAALAGTAALIARRRRLACAYALGAALAGAGLLAPARAPRSRDPASANATLRVMVLNARSASSGARATADAILAAEPDVAVILETPAELFGFLREGSELRALMPFGWVPPSAGPGFTVVLTRWAQRGGPDWSGDASATFADGVRAMIVDRPSGAFCMLVLHPDSPRSAGRWRRGNRLIEHAVGVVAERLRPTGLPILIAGDLNASPPSWRSRRLCAAAGVRRAKPLLVPAGTWPAPSFWPLRVAIDDVLASPGVAVSSWRTAAIPGSDHSAVVAELVMPAPSAARRPPLAARAERSSARRSLAVTPNARAPAPNTAP